LFFYTHRQLAVSDYRKDYPNGKDFQRNRVLNLKTMVNLLLSMQGGSLAFFLKWYNFTKKTLIVADRGYESYNVFAHFLEHPNMDFLIRVKQDKSAMRKIGKLPMTELDTEVSFTITTTQTKVDKPMFINTPAENDKALRILRFLFYKN